MMNLVKTLVMVFALTLATTVWSQQEWARPRAQVTSQGQMIQTEIQPIQQTFFMIKLRYVNPAIIAQVFGGTVIEANAMSGRGGNRGYGGNGISNGYGGSNGCVYSLELDHMNMDIRISEVDDKCRFQNTIPTASILNGSS